MMLTFIVGASVLINGVEDKEIQDAIKCQILNMDTTREQLNGDLFQIRCKRDTEIVKEILDSYGYFDNEVIIKRVRDKVVFDINLKERYKFNCISIQYKDDEAFRTGITEKDAFKLIGKKQGDYTNTVELDKSLGYMERYFKEKGFAFVDIKNPTLSIDRERKFIKVIYNVKLNKKIKINNIIVNVKSLKNSEKLMTFVKNKAFWKSGDFYDISSIEYVKDELQNSGIFSSIEILLGEPITDPNNDNIGFSDVIINVEEALLRDISAGVKFGSTEKLGFNLAWTHYNIDGHGSKFSAIAETANTRKELGVKYTLHDIFYKHQKLKMKVGYVREKTDTYNTNQIGSKAMLWQAFSPKISAGIGAAFEVTRTTDKINYYNIENFQFDRRRYQAFSIPVGVNFDTTKDYLDPQGGFRFDALASPYVGFKIKSFTVLSCKSSLYIPMFSDGVRNKVVLACYAKAGSIIARADGDIPRDKLFFSGGAGSIRGYGYQKIGEVTEQKKPVGGESIFEIGVEPRFRVSETIGIVAFIEGGNVFNTRIPKVSKKLMWGWGFGARYYTSFAPIRFDIAFPFKRRKLKSGRRIDSLFNIYISIGQSF